MKKIIACILCAVMTLGMFSTTAYADDYKTKWEEELKYRTQYGKAKDPDFELWGDGDGGIVISAEELEYIKQKKSADIVFKYEFDESISEEVKKSFGDKMHIKLYSSYDVCYTYTYHAKNTNFVKVSDILKKSGVRNPSSIIGVVLSNHNPCVLLTDYSFNLIKQGWNTINNTDYYVKFDGTLATKSTIIGGVRYKFTSDGVCHGKYTGWTKSSAGRKYWKDGKMLTKSAIIDGVRYKIKSNGICEGKYTGWTTSGKGKRYWKNGLLVTEKYIRTTSGKKYYADKNGYVTVVNN